MLHYYFTTMYSTQVHRTENTMHCERLPRLSFFLSSSILFFPLGLEASATHWPATEGSSEGVPP